MQRVILIKWKVLPVERNYKTWTEEVKYTSLTKEDVPTEEVLGVHCNVEKDFVCFKIDLKETKLKRRHMLQALNLFYHPLKLVTLSLLKGRTILQDL